MQKKLIWIIIAAVLLIASLAVIVYLRPEEADTEPALSGTLVIAGSTSVAPITEELDRAFEARHPEVRIDVHSTGSSAGIRSAADGTAGIGMSSRNLSTAEKGLGLTETVIARDAIVVIVHPRNPVNDLTTEQLRGIYTGKITNWREVGGRDARIMAITRETGSGTRAAFEEMVMDRKPIFPGAITMVGAGGVKAALVGAEHGIAYISLWGVDATVKVVKIDGVMPTAESVLAGKFGIARPYILITRGVEVLERAFIDFVLSAEGQKIIEEAGLVRVR
ncbi:MAG: Phosphate-binding protein PstS [Syntrophomonadaceae bacterium]|nr:Phosphate-binding protein PstS [Bacillota bacterium]